MSFNLEKNRKLGFDNYHKRFFPFDKDGHRKHDPYTPKVRWKLSEFAKCIIEHDTRNYNIQTESETKLSKIYNIIFLNYFEEASSSVIMQLEKISGISDEERNVLIKYFMKTIEDKYLKEKASQVNSRISSKSLVELGHNSNEDKAYGKNEPGKYFRAVLEEYARLPDVERERILYKDIHNHIIEAMENTEVIQITVNANQKNDTHKIIPLKKPRLSNNGNAYYVVGVEIKDSSEKLRLYSAKISQISNIDNLGKTEESLKKNLKQKQAKIINLIENNDAAFLRNGIHLYKVAFTEQGKKRLFNITHLRPKIVDPSQDTYNINIKDKDYDPELFEKYKEKLYVFYFECSETNMKYYLQRFGADALVVKDDHDEYVSEEKQKELYDDMLKIYENAYNKYKKFSDRS